MAVTLDVLGCRAGRPDPETPCSGYVLSARRRRILIDCGPGILRELLRQGLDQTLDGVVLTHLHQDHMNDIVPLAFSRLLATRPPPRIPLWIPEESVEMLSALDEIMSVPSSPRVRGNPLEHAFDIRPLSRDGTTTIRIASGLELTAYRAHHAVPSAALAFTMGNLRAVFSSDTGWCDELIAAAKHADVFVCEATFLDADPTILEGHGHLTATLAGRVAMAAEVKKLVLTHLMHGDDEDTARTAARAEAPGVDVSLAHPGHRITITPHSNDA